MTDAVSSASSASVTSKIGDSRSRLADSEQTFMNLLTTQLKNQDPLSPLDSNEFTAQIVQMTGVEQQLLTNDLLSALVGLSDGGLASSVNLIGKSVTVDTNKAALASGAASWNTSLNSAAASVKYEVVNSLGQTVWSRTDSNVAAGERALNWDGKSTSGQQQVDGGIYTLKITATDAAGKTIGSSISQTGVVTAVETLDGQTVASLGKLKTPISSITAVRAVS